MNNRSLFSILNISNKNELKAFSKKSKIPVPKLNYYNNERKFPSPKDLDEILIITQLSELEFRIKLGVFNSKIKDLLSQFSKEIVELLSDLDNITEQEVEFSPLFDLDSEQEVEFSPLFDLDSEQEVQATAPLAIDPEYKVEANPSLEVVSEHDIEFTASFDLDPEQEVDFTPLFDAEHDIEFTASFDLGPEQEVEFTPLFDLNSKEKDEFTPLFTTDFGKLYQEDSIELMKTLPSESVDLIFADPPFNLDKVYESEMNDKLTKDEYLRWTEEWVMESVRLLKEGGSFFIWNIPSWNTHTAEILNQHLNLRHWVAVDIKYSLPIQNKLYPSHYSLLYYVKGEKPNTFNAERLPLEICRHCAGDIKDYGGYKNKLNVNGLSLPDVWRDISPVRHKKYKTRGSNQLPVNLLERIISMASNEGDTVFDPFGGSGTTFIVSEVLKRNWIGSEIGPIDQIVERFKDIDSHKVQIKEIQSKKNVLFTDSMRERREKHGHWLPETLI